MSDIKQAFSTQSSALTVTNLNNLSSSLTGGWCSAPITNTTDLYADILLEITLTFAGTAPGSQKCVFVYAYEGDGSVYETTGAATGGTPSGSEGTITFPDITASQVGFHVVGVIPYSATGVAQTRYFSLAQAFGGFIPPKWGIALVNASGAAIGGSGNNIYWRGVYATVS